MNHMRQSSCHIVEPPIDVVNLLCTTPASPILTSTQVEGFTEHRQKGHTYRSHPNYQSSGPWYDWVLVHFDDSNENTAEVRNGKQGGAKKQKISHLYPSTDVPSKILCFYTDPIEGDVRALVHSCEYSDHVDDSILCEVWNLEYECVKVYDHGVGDNVTDQFFQNPQRRKDRMFPIIYAVSVETFEEPQFVAQEYPGIFESVDPNEKQNFNCCLLVSNREQYWADHFTG